MSGSALVAPRRLGGECGRERDRFDPGLEGGVEEVGDRDALDALGRADHAVRRRAEVAAAHQLQQLADVDHERAGQRGDGDPLAVDLGLEAADGVLVQEGEEAGVGVLADALVGREVLAGRRVADDLGQDLGRRDHRVEVVGRLAERERHRAHQRVPGLLDRRVVLADGRAERRQPFRPQVRPAQAQPGRIVGPDLGRGQLPADVDLIAEVAPPVGVLVAQARVAAELRRMHVLDRQPLRLGKGEELLGDLPHAGDEVVRDAVADEVGGADAVEGVAQRLDERRAGGAVRVRTEAGDVEDGERGRCAHGSPAYGASRPGSRTARPAPDRGTRSRGRRRWRSRRAPRCRAPAACRPRPGGTRRRRAGRWRSWRSSASRRARPGRTPRAGGCTPPGRPAIRGTASPPAWRPCAAPAPAGGRRSARRPRCSRRAASAPAWSVGSSNSSGSGSSSFSRARARCRPLLTAAVLVPRISAVSGAENASTSRRMRIARWRAGRC